MRNIFLLSMRRYDFCCKVRRVGIGELLEDLFVDLVFCLFLSSESCPPATEVNGAEFEPTEEAEDFLDKIDRCLVPEGYL